MLAGVRAYQHADRPAFRPDRPVAAQVGRARLLDGGSSGVPVVLVPSLINGAEILDLDADRSLLSYLAACGLRPLLVDWGCPGAEEHARDIAAHVAELLVPLIARLDEPPFLVGYCLGGTMALAAATLVPARAVALLAAPWRFAGYSESRTMLQALWQEARPAAEALGLLPMDVLQAAFWQLDPTRTLDKFAAFSRVSDKPAAVRKFVPVEDWANGGAPLTHAAARELIEDMMTADVTGEGRWQVAGRRVRPEDLGCELLEIVSLTDRIVPAATATGIGTPLALRLGHVGMIVGGEARRQLWEPLVDWLRSR